MFPFAQAERGLRMGWSVESAIPLGNAVRKNKTSNVNEVQNCRSGAVVNSGYDHGGDDVHIKVQIFLKTDNV